MAMRAKKRAKAGYMISAVAELYKLHPQTLRLYERVGLLKPSRSQGNTRLYTDSDLERLDVILTLARDMGVNLAGIEIILNMREKLIEMERQMGEFAHVVQQDRGLLVRIGVDRDTALLHQDAAEVVGGVEGDAGKVASHCGLLGVGASGRCLDQLSNTMSTSMPAGVYSSSRARRLASRISVTSMAPMIGRSASASFASLARLGDTNTTAS